MKFRFPLKALLAGAVVVATTMMAVACGGGDEEEAPGAAVKTPGGPGTPAATAPGGGTPSGETGETITLLLKDNFYDPKNFKVPVNKSITFILKNEGTVIHNFHVLSKKSEGKDFQSQPTIAAKTEDKLTVKFTKKGKVNFQCDYHVPDMVGTITVE